MIKILILESFTIDINYIFKELDLSKQKYQIKTIKFSANSLNLNNNYKPDIIIAAYSTVQNAEKEALKISASWCPVVPIILVADFIEIDDCVSLIKKGVSEIVLLQNISTLSRKIYTALRQDLQVHGKNLSDYREEKCSEKSIYSSLIKNSTDAILLTLKDAQILEANPAACQIFEMTEDEICLAGRHNLVDENDPNLQLIIDERNLNGFAKGELRFKRKDGSSFIAEVTSLVFKDEFGCEKTSIIIRDLTQSKKADKHLAKTAAEVQEALNKLNKVMNSSMDLIFSIDEEKNIVQINSASSDILGYEPYELLHKNYGDLIFKEDQEKIFSIDQDTRNGNPLKNFEARIIHKNGTIVTIMVSAVWDNDDKLIYCTAKDITAKKNLEKAYDVERQRFLDFYNLSPACMAILKGPSHIHELANPLYLKLVNRKDIIGRSVIEILPEMEAQGIIALLDAVYKTGVPFIANDMLILIDLNDNGELVDMYMNFMYQAHRNSQGIIDGIFVFAIDVTEQVLSRIQIEQSAKMYHQLISELPVAAYSCDLDGKIVFFNKATAKLWGTDPKIGEDSFCGFAQIFNNEGQSIPLEFSPMAISLKEGKIVSSGSCIVKRVDGERRYVVPHIVPYIDSLGRVTGAVNMVTDITESKAASTSLELQNTLLAFENQEKENRAAELAIANTELAYQNTEKENRANELAIANYELAFQIRKKKIELTS